MNESTSTRAALLTAARRLFARWGYEGTSIKMITSLARANLGAVTYHYGTKAKLYDEVLRAEGEPLLAGVQRVGACPGRPLDRIDAVVRAFLRHVSEHRDLPALMLHVLSLRRPVPVPIRRVMAGVYRVVTQLVREGQRDGSIVAGDPALLTISILAQPIYVTLARRPLRAVAGLDTGDPAVGARIADHVVSFLRRGLSPSRRRAS